MKTIVITDKQMPAGLIASIDNYDGPHDDSMGFVFGGCIDAPDFLPMGSIIGGGVGGDFVLATQGLTRGLSAARHAWLSL